jgi:hypothetical protein
MSPDQTAYPPPARKRVAVVVGLGLAASGLFWWLTRDGAAEMDDATSPRAPRGEREYAYCGQPAATKYCSGSCRNRAYRQGLQANREGR